MKKNVSLIVSLVFVLAVVAFFLVLQANTKKANNEQESNNKNTNSQVNETAPLDRQDPSSIPNIERDEIKSDKPAFEEYVRANISQLSKEEAVLGGTFYVTDIKWVGDNSALVSYEDGHIALEALARYVIDDEDKVEVTYFEVIPLLEGSAQPEPESEISQELRAQFESDMRSNGQVEVENELE